MSTKTLSNTCRAELAALAPKKHDAIVRFLERALIDEMWRAKAQSDAAAWLDYKTEKPLRKKLEATIEREWTAQGAGWNGRWES